MLSRVRRQPRHATKRAPRRRQVPEGRRAKLHLHLHLPKPPLPKARLPHLRIPKPHLRLPSSPVPAVLALVRRWRGGQGTLSLERRRARTMLVGAIAVASVVLLTSFPLGAVLSQRSALSGTGHELSLVQAENESLARQVSDLANPGTLNGLARHDYGFVQKGQRAYDVLPSSSPSGTALSASNQVPLGGPPVVPGSPRSQALIGIVAPLGATDRSAVTAAVQGAGSGSGTAPRPEPRSYWARVVRSLEFWN